MSTHDDNTPAQAPEDKTPKLTGIDYSKETDVPKIHESLLREQKDSIEGNEPVPFWLMIVVMFVLFGCGIYWGAYSGSFDGMVYDESAGAATGGKGATAEVALDPAVEFLKMGKREFNNNCASCHQPSGLGIPGQYPPLAKSEWVQGPERRVISIVLHGLEGPVTVEGNVFNGAMPPWGASKNDKQIAAILTYVRQEWGNKADPISPDQVKAIRAEEAARSKVWSEAELKALPADPVPGGTPAAPAPADKKS